MIFRAACLLTVSSAFPQEASEGSEQTGLLQKIRRGEILVNEGSEESHTRLTKLFESTSDLLRSGTTPAVINFTIEVLKEIEDTALPAITDSSKTDQKLLDGSMAAFIPIRDQYLAKMAEFEALRKTEGQTSQNHKSCRKEETESCGNFAACTYKLKTDWDDYVVQRAEFKEIHGHITTGICPKAEPWGTFPQDWKLGTEYKKESDGNYTWTYRDNIEKYIKQGEEYFKAKDAYEAQNKTCVSKKSALQAKTGDCDALKIMLEKESCASKTHHKTWQDVFDETWAMASVNLVNNTHNTKQQEHDRKVEYQSIKSVQCLLERIESTGGMPCDDKLGNGTADAQIAQCRIIDISTTWLNLSYLPEPAQPAQTPLSPHPCQQKFVDNEYKVMKDQQCGKGDVGDEEFTKDEKAWVVQLKKPICDAAQACTDAQVVTTTPAAAVTAAPAVASK